MKRTAAIREIWVGVLLTVAFVVFFILLLSIGEQQNLLAPKNLYHARFQQTQGLSVGAPVRLEGVPIGSVTDISFADDPSDFRIDVTFQVERSMAPRIRTDTKALIVTQGIIGEVLLGLKRGSVGAPQAEPDAYLPTIETGTLEEFKTQGQVIAENILTISSDISKIMDRIEKGEGLLARLLTDDDYAKTFLARLDRTSDSMEQIVHKLNEGETFLGRLLAEGDPKSAEAADAVFDSIERVNSILATVDRGEGTLGRLLKSDEEFENLVSSLSEMSRSIRNLTHQLEHGEGLLTRMIRDEEWADEMIEDLRSTADNFAEVAEKINGGDGTLGQLVDDPTVYDGLKDLVGGMQKSRVLRWFIRRNVSAGAKAEMEQEIQEDTTEGDEPEKPRRRSRKKDRKK